MATTGSPSSCRDSVIATALFPGAIAGIGPIAVDRAGLTGQGGRVTGNWGRSWTNLGSDGIDLVDRPMKVSSSRNRPTPHRQMARPPLLPTGEIQRGYLEAAEALATIEIDPALLARCRPRLLFRNTSDYVDVVRELLRPERLTSEATFTAVLDDQRWSAAVEGLGVPESDGRRWQDALLNAERAALTHLDVPAFTFAPTTGAVRIGATDYLGVTGRPPVDDFDRRRDNIASVDHRNRQVAMIGIALQGHRRGTRATPERFGPAPRASDEHTDATIISMTRAIMASALEIDGVPRWLIADPAGPSTLLRPWLSGGDLYRGSAGIGLSLAAVSAHLDVPGAAELARVCVATGESLLAPPEGPGPAGGLAGGRSGWAYAAAHVGSIVGDDELVSRAARTVLTDPVLIDRHDELDLIGGWAGVALAAATVAELAGDATLGDRAETLAEQIATELDRRDRIADVAPHHRLGIAHGSFGVRLALRRAGGDQGFAVADRLGEVERHRIADRGGVPARVHRENGEVRADLSWCWGTAGYLAAGPDPQYDAVARATTAGPIGEIDRLCCGTAGRLAALSLAGHHLEAAPLRDFLVGAWDLGTLVGESPIDYLDPTLFRGLAGIAYALLASRHRTVNLLAFAP